MDKEKNLKRLTWFIIGSVEAALLLLAFVTITRAQVRNAPPYEGPMDGTVYFPVTNRGFNYSVTGQQLKDSLSGGGGDGKNIGNSNLSISRQPGTIEQRTLTGGDSTAIIFLLGGTKKNTMFAQGTNVFNLSVVADDSTKKNMGVFFDSKIMSLGESSMGTSDVLSRIRIFKQNKDNDFPNTVCISSNDKTLYLTGNEDGSTFPGGLTGGVILDFSRIQYNDVYRRVFFPNDSGTILLDTDTATFLATKHDLAGENLQKVTDRGSVTTNEITASALRVKDDVPGHYPALYFQPKNPIYGVSEIKLDENNGVIKFNPFANYDSTIFSAPFVFGSQVQGNAATHDNNFVTLGQMNDSTNAAINLQKATTGGNQTTDTVYSKGFATYISQDVFIGGGSFHIPIIKWGTEAPFSIGHPDAHWPDIDMTIGSIYWDSDNQQTVFNQFGAYNPTAWRFVGRVSGAPAIEDSNFVTLEQMTDSIQYPAIKRVGLDYTILETDQTIVVGATSAGDKTSILRLQNPAAWPGKKLTLVNGWNGTVSIEIVGSLGNDGIRADLTNSAEISNLYQSGFEDLSLQRYSRITIQSMPLGGGAYQWVITSF